MPAAVRSAQYMSQTARVRTRRYKAGIQSAYKTGQKRRLRGQPDWRGSAETLSTLIALGREYSKNCFHLESRKKDAIVYPFLVVGHLPCTAAVGYLCSLLFGAFALKIAYWMMLANTVIGTLFSIMFYVERRTGDTILSQDDLLAKLEPGDKRARNAFKNLCAKIKSLEPLIDEIKRADDILSKIIHFDKPEITTLLIARNNAADYVASKIHYPFQMRPIKKTQVKILAALDRALRDPTFSKPIESQHKLAAVPVPLPAPSAPVLAAV